jgi:ATP-dependent Lon protease
MMLGVLRRQGRRLLATPASSSSSSSSWKYPLVLEASTTSWRPFSDDSSNKNDEDKKDDDDDDNNSKKDKEKYKKEKKRSVSVISIAPTSKLGFGEDAPRTPHVMALPVINRPLFPGVVTSVTLTDPDTIRALEALQRGNTEAGKDGETSSSNIGSSNSYVSVFLRQNHPTGVSEGGVLLPTPEVITDISDIYKVGTFAQIHRLARGSGLGSAKPSSNGGGRDEGSGEGKGGDDDEEDEDTTATVLLLAHRRVNLVSVDELGPPVDATVAHWPRLDYTGDNDTIRALQNEIISAVREVATLNPLFKENVQFFGMRFDSNDPYRLADFAASVCSAGRPEDLQAVLEEKDPELRLHKALVLLNREREVSKLQREISSKVEEKMTEAQRKYFLMEQLKSIKKELGMEKDDKQALIAKYRKQLAKYRDIPKDVSSTIESELEKLSTLEMNSSEYNVTRSYLDWLVGVPWGVVSDENFEIRDARQVLDRDHYGLDDVKDTILEFIAVGKLRGTVKGKIVCLAGPPGTGKTSIAKSVASSLGREFYRFSVGGLSNVAEIKGHRRTYVGAMPGKLIQCLKTTGTINPVILIDEIDKLGHGYQGDPASALLEVLDPSQNTSFHDHYLDIPVDLSKVLFMCTANELERIPEPLLDRMEVIRLSGYDFPEKVAIAEQYLVPKAMRDSGLMVERGEEEEGSAKEGGDKTPSEKSKNETKQAGNDEDDEKLTPLEKFVHSKKVPAAVGMDRSAIESLVRWYCREAGVRSLAKYIDKITRKLALQVVAEEEGAVLTQKSRRKSPTWTVTETNLHEYVGKPIFTSDRLYEKDPLPNGIVMGLAYTSMGGSALYIETQGIRRGRDADGKSRGGGTVKATGKLGDVMKESSQIAYTVARAIISDLDETNQFFDNTDIHMHVPEGATPKDGPSAGIAMVTSMLSLAMEKPISNDLAMTGEISLTGKVLPVGGIKEKIMGGRRAGIKSIILPMANQRDYDEIPEYLKEGLDVYFADDYDKVYEVAFGPLKKTVKAQSQCSI